MQKINLKIVTPERTVFEDSVDSISVMTEIGEITILPNHAPLVSLLRSGEMRLKDGGNESLLAVSTGLIEVRNENSVVVLADSAERSEELTLEEIEKAKDLAEKRLQEARNQGDVVYADALVHLERELARYKVARKGKYRDVGKQ
ncbi:ATP synthase F1 subunit epsilon [Candidatus Uhrbacteria bacterium CG_4_9_14_0_2_um_filter_41_50]|uniref:ATP synthase epsilon chain n=1 Tax=Candidatus Uhrbacteria bacterium CG_4_9_14_0_2_um_filter_41_50 TaxID=1975031 RepID=A0A2M8EP33_9BACT|nr:MAG: ATP synthase F1 subunit epsilon [Candidatus Uhrbacteria bacterium CG_4_10_14_3_um_filter_41_21]PIZ54399.1 MAG: ATP synthase F1 subunit epsilon [Candidatus Uhrbacteria bacterium CG_4_10_14_0_2_um_filter_41_21]PJB84997.1 MAG: ATP synthase F1 subunit epsilon [Candidatus Uhrbacteria bacterium CG_4_9_14_0_8_um_filter_41_16]PJC24504.1 MAG: ATP synthase F1 subunit epsilon [Candidatus Uhrbacteria bacterium CG_4_9_14_0_2_um_filter_41_50]PJE74730.1 MAG: ATP synthase F1 subunit epsilon [Candidatus